MKFKKIYFFVICIACALSHKYTVQKSSEIQNQDLIQHAYLNNMLANTLSVTFEEQEILDRTEANNWFRGENSEHYRLVKANLNHFSKSEQILVEQLKLQSSEEIDFVQRIIDSETEELESWHVVSIVDSRKSTRSTSIFRFDREEKELYLHILEHNHTQASKALSGRQIGHFVSHFGDSLTKGVPFKYEYSSIEEDLMLDTVYLSFLKLCELRQVDPYHVAKELEFALALNEENGHHMGEKLLNWAIKTIVKNAIKIAKFVVKFFKNKFRQKFLQTLKQDGFTKYSLKATVKRQLGIKEKHFKKYTKYVIDTLTNGRKKHQEKIRACLDIIEFADQNTWSLDEVNLDTGKGSFDKFFSIMAAKDDVKGDFHFMIVNSVVNYKLAPNLLIFEDSKSIAGGFFQERKIRIKKVPRSVTEEEVQGISVFNRMITTKLLYDHLLGKSLEFPKI